MRTVSLFLGLALRGRCLFLRDDLVHLMHGVKVAGRLSVGVAHPVCPGEVLPVVHCEVHVMQRMMCGSVDDLLQWVVRDHVRIVYQDRPHIDENKEDQVEMSLKWEEEDEEMVWD